MVLVPAAKNLAVNPSVEVAISGWAASVGGGTSGTAAISRVSTWAKEGSWSAYTILVGPTTRTYVQITSATSSGDTRRIIVPAGATAVSASIWARCNVPGQTQGQMRLGISFRTAAGAVVGSTAYSPYIKPNNLTDTLLTLENVAVPATAAYAFITVMLYHPTSTATALPASSELWVDALMFNTGPTVEPYFDGDRPGSQYTWDGTAHDSTSSRAAYTYSNQTYPTRGKTLVSAELWRHSLTNEPLEEITKHALTGKVTYNSNADLKGSLTLAVQDHQRGLGLTDLLAPFVTITTPDGTSTRYQMGLFVVPPNKETLQASGLKRGELTGFDVLWYMANNAPVTVVNYASTANVVDTVIGIVESHGLRVAIPASSKTFGTARSYHPDKSWLQIANDMLTGIGYYSLWASRSGVVKSRPYFELATAEPSLELYSGEGSSVIGNLEKQYPTEPLYNRVVVYKANPQGDPLIASRTNADPTSPISTVATGRTLTRRVVENTIVDQASADALAQRLLEEAASGMVNMTVNTLPLPDRDLHEVYNLAIYDDNQAVAAFGKWWCDKWDMSLGFKPVSATMVHSLRRLEPYGGMLG